MKEEAQVEVTFEDCKEENKDVIIALLDNIGFNGFDESNAFLKAYIDKSNYNDADLKTIADSYSLPFTTKEIQPQNWNALWESNFEPVIIDDFVAVRAHFHEPIINVEHEIVITPKMSFGTGHHATTTMMVQQMRDLEFLNKSVFDFGTGTGILAILAEKLGADNVLAIDNDSWSIENSRENIERNQCRYIKIELSDSAIVSNTFDIILANINRNVILDNLVFLNDRLHENGYLLLSGLLLEDEDAIIKESKHYPLIHQNTRQLGQWISLLFSR